jgi:hypothetical protein
LLQWDSLRRTDDTTRRALTDVQRAFISISELREEAIENKAGARIWRYVPAIENSGNTPAVQLRMISITPLNDWMVGSTLRHREFDKLRDQRTLPPADFKERMNEIQISVGPIDPADIFSWRQDEIPPDSMTKDIVFGPKAKIYLPKTGAEITIDDVLIMSGLKPPTHPTGATIGRFFYGAIEYHDIFNEKRITKYCFRIDSYTIMPSGDKPNVDFCSHWNCTDGTCDDDKRAYEADLVRFAEKEAKDQSRKAHTKATRKSIDEFNRQRHMQELPPTPSPE